MGKRSLVKMDPSDTALSNDVATAVMTADSVTADCSGRHGDRDD